MPMADDPLQEQAKAMVAKWQQRLRLMDWNIRVEVCRHFRMPEPLNGAEVGHIVIHGHTKDALIDLCHPDDIHPDTIAYDLEQTVIHELLHIHLDPWDTTVGTWEDRMQEIAINHIADALLAMDKGGNA